MLRNRQFNSLISTLSRSCIPYHCRAESIHLDGNLSELLNRSKERVDGSLKLYGSERMQKRDVKYTEIGKVKTRYTEKGKGEPLILIHGGYVGQNSTFFCWDHNFDRLAEEYHVVAFDKLGMGFTDNPPEKGPFTTAATTKHAYDFLKSLKLDKVHIVAHSRGGLTAIRLALEYPDFVRSMTLIDSGSVAPDNPPRIVDFYKDLENSIKDLPTREAIVSRTIGNSYSKDHITDLWIDDLVEAYNLPKSIEAKKRTSGLGSLDTMPDTREQRADTNKQVAAGKLKAPTLLFWGYNDPSALVERGINLYRQMCETVPRVEMHVFNHAGHYSFREHPVAFNETLLGFLKSVK